MILQSVAGLILFTFFAWTISENRKRVPWRIIAAGMGLQLILALLLLKFSLFSDLLLSLNRVVLSLEEATNAGTSFVFGFLGGGALPFDEKFPGASFVFAFKALPLILLVSALSSLLFYWGILQRIVKFFSLLLMKTMGVGGAEGVGVSANVFVGMVEAPLFIRPYLREVTRSELFTLMTCGMATIAGTVMVLYAGILRNTVPGIMGHILTASIISVPAAIVISKIMVPETGKPTYGEITSPEVMTGPMDAITKGTIRGVDLLINVMAMMIVLVALVHLVNLMLGLFPQMGGEALTLQRIFGILMAPVVWLMGVPWAEAHTAGTLLGTKTILNEFIAYLNMTQLPEGSLGPRSLVIMSYALCGFANPGSLGIMIGGMGAMAPERRDEIVSLGFRSIIAGTLSTCMTGAVVGILLS